MGYSQIVILYNDLFGDKTIPAPWCGDCAIETTIKLLVDIHLHEVVLRGNVHHMARLGSGVFPGQGVNFHGSSNSRGVTFPARSHASTRIRPRFADR